MWAVAQGWAWFYNFCEEGLRSSKTPGPGGKQMANVERPSTQMQTSTVRVRRELLTDIVLSD